MRRFLSSLAVIGLALPAAISLPAAEAIAKDNTYSGSTTHRHRVCTKSKGTAGLIGGGVVGAVVGGKAIGHGVLGPIIGAAGGALAGRAVDRTITAKRRCHWVND
jgi:hypothetical protein